MSYGLQDVIMLRQMLAESGADDAHKRVERHKLDAMLGLCELTGCRRQALLAYFGETLPEPCGNCDTCLTPPETWDATVVAQKALSCVHRTGQRFGVMYLIDVLLGKDDERIRRFGHDRITTFGIGTELGAKAWRGVFRQLIARGLLSVDVDGHGGLHLTDACRAVLRGEEQLWLRREAAGGQRSGRSAAAGSLAAVDGGRVRSGRGSGTLGCAARTAHGARQGPERAALCGVPRCHAGGDGAPAPAGSAGTGRAVRYR